jgi:hypothetical protein
MAKNIFGLSGNKNELMVEKVTQLSVSDDPFERYKLFTNMYDSNNFYQEIRKSAYQNGTYLENIFSIANSAHRSVEFYANRLLMGATITTNDEQLKEAINIFLRDSNFDGRKDNYSREIAKLGDLFIKIKNNKSRVWQELIEAKHVSFVVTDSRGIVTEIRIDIPQGDGKWYTEYWTVDEFGNGYTAVWENHRFGKDAELDQLGTPTFQATLAEFGLTFIPIVYSTFTSTGKRSVNSFVHAISKQIEGDREHSRLAEIMYAFNNAIWSAESDGLTDKGQLIGKIDVKFIKSDDGQVIQHVKNGKLKPNIPQLDYASHVSLIKLTKEEVMQDLPETKINSLDPSQISGRAVQQLLGESINRAKTARNNLLHALKRLNMMALTVGQSYGLFDKSLGNYVEGDFRHEIECDDIVPLDKTDKALMLQQLTSGGMPLKSSCRFIGMTQTEIEQVMADRDEEDARLAMKILSNPAFTRDNNNSNNQGG